MIIKFIYVLTHCCLPGVKEWNYTVILSFIKQESIVSEALNSQPADTPFTLSKDGNKQLGPPTLSYIQPTDTPHNVPGRYLEAGIPNTVQVKTPHFVYQSHPSRPDTKFLPQSTLD